MNKLIETAIKYSAALLLYFLGPLKPLETRLFEAIIRLWPGIAIEAVCLRAEKNGIEVYLIKRSEKESAYPGLYHSPGTFLRYGEGGKEFESTFKRLQEQEIGNRFLSWEKIEVLNNLAEIRGHIVQIIYLCTIGDDNIGKGEWFLVNQLPENIVPQHRDVIIPLAVKAFLAK
jgi:ADP-ribose pyrophosphatase YjhB (NUDIX family)